MAELRHQKSPGPDVSRLSLQLNNTIVTSKVFPKGDVILVISEKTRTTRIRVSSLILCCASPMFETILGPQFAGPLHALVTHQMEEISLNIDDAPAMIWLCKLLHHQHEDKTSLNFPSVAARLHRLSIVADKYCCRSAIQLAATGLLGQFATSSVLRVLPLKSIIYLIAVSERFRHRRYFALFTRRLIMDYVPNTAPYRKLSSFSALQLLPKSFLGTCRFVCASFR